jgi:hypothetical protein
LQEVDGGHGQWGNQDDLTLHFGMGQSCESEVTVRWPNENLTTQSFVLQAGHRYLIIEGQEPLKVENH